MFWYSQLLRHFSYRKCIVGTFRKLIYLNNVHEMSKLMEKFITRWVICFTKHKINNNIFDSNSKCNEGWRSFRTRISHSTPFICFVFVFRMFDLFAMSKVKLFDATTFPCYWKMCASKNIDTQSHRMNLIEPTIVVVFDC